MKELIFFHCAANLDEYNCILWKALRFIESFLSEVYILAELLKWAFLFPFTFCVEIIHNFRFAQKFVTIERVFIALICAIIDYFYWPRNESYVKDWFFGLVIDSIKTDDTSAARERNRYRVVYNCGAFTECLWATHITEGVLIQPVIRCRF